MNLKEIEEKYLAEVGEKVATIILSIDKEMIYNYNTIKEEVPKEPIIEKEPEPIENRSEILDL